MLILRTGGCALDYWRVHTDTGSRALLVSTLHCTTLLLLPSQLFLLELWPKVPNNATCNAHGEFSAELRALTDDTIRCVATTAHCA
eukprot:2285932-Pyramimonas_sp.AAC.1